MTLLPKLLSTLSRKPKQGWDEDSLILTKGKHIYALLYGNLCREVMNQFHDINWRVIRAYIQQSLL